MVTEKAGKIKFRRANGTIAEITGAPKVLNDEQGGLLDIVDEFELKLPDYDKAAAKESVKLTKEKVPA